MNSIQNISTVSPSLSPEGDFSAQAGAFLQTWTDGTLKIPEPEPNPLDAYSRYLSGYYKIPLEASYLISNSVINAAVAASIRLKGPGTNTTAAALNTMLVSESGARLQFAIEDAFHAIRPLANRMAVSRQTFTEKSAEDVKGRAAELLKQAGEMQSSAAKTRSPDNPNLKSSDSDWCGPKWAVESSGIVTQDEMNERDACDAERKATALRRDAAKIISGYHFHDKPGFFVEGVLPEELVASHDLCADGSIFNLDIDANTWMSMTGLSRAKSREISSRLNAAWRAATVAQKGEILPASTISSLSRMSSDDFLKFWANPRTRENRLQSIILPVNTDFAGTYLEDVSTKNEHILQFFERTTKLLLQRIEGRQQEDILLSREAKDMFLSFVGGIEGIANFQPQIRELLRPAGSMALRQSLLLHLGNGDSKQLSSQTMKRACHLTAWSICGTAHMLENNQAHRRPGTDDSDHEVWVMVAKVRKKGPLSRRDLFRTFHDQTSSLHLPIVEKALSKGLLRETDDGSLYAPDNKDL